MEFTTEKINTPEEAVLQIEANKASEVTIIEAEPLPKKGRGRPKGSLKFKTETPPKEADKAQATTGKPVDSEIEKLRAEHNELNKGAIQTVSVDNKTTVDKNKTQFINGYLLLIVCDLFFPMVISMVFKKTLKENGKTRKHLKLSQKDREEMMPLADACAKELSVTMSATQAFLIGMSCLYASKVDE